MTSTDALRSRLVRVTQETLGFVSTHGVVSTSAAAEAVVAALLQVLRLRQEQAVQYESSASGRTLTLGAYTLPGQAAEAAKRPELEGCNPRVVERLVGPWVSVSPNPEETK